MKLTKYGILLKVLEYGSFSQTSDKLKYTQSAISQSIASLENELGVTLLTRNKKGISLTQSGEMLIPYIQAIYNAENALFDKVNDMNQIRTGNIRIGTFTSVSCHFLPQVMNSFGKKYPLISFELIQGDYPEIESWILNGMVDIGFLRLPISSKLDLLPFRRDPVYAVLPPTSRFADADTYPVSAFESEPFIMLDEGNNHELFHYFKSNQVKPNIIYKVRDDYTIMSMVENGLGISILPAPVLKRSPYRIVSKPLEPFMERQLCIACRDKKTLSMAAKLFIREMQQCIGMNQQGL